jgi:hypothetical protein
MQETRAEKKKAVPGDLKRAQGLSSQEAKARKRAAVRRRLLARLGEELAAEEASRRGMLQ